MYCHICYVPKDKKMAELETLILKYKLGAKDRGKRPCLNWGLVLRTSRSNSTPHSLTFTRTHFSNTCCTNTWMGNQVSHGRSSSDSSQCFPPTTPNHLSSLIPMTKRPLFRCLFIRSLLPSRSFPRSPQGHGSTMGRKETGFPQLFRET